MAKKKKKTTKTAKKRAVKVAEEDKEEQKQDTIILKKKKWYRKKWFYIVLILCFIGGGIVYGQMKKGDKAPEYETVTVERGSLKQTVDATGYIESADELDLAFETMGRVGKIYKNVNDEVSKGEIVTELELNELNSRISQANASISRAKANLDKEIAGSTDEEKANLKAKLAQAKANLEQKKAQYDNSIQDAESAIDTAENNLKLSEGGENSLIVQDAYDDMVALMQSIQNTLAKTLVSVDNILGIDDKTANDDFEDELSASSPSKLIQANTKYYVAKNNKTEFDSLSNGISTLSSNEDVDAVVDVAESALLSIKELLFAVTDVLNATPAIGDLTQTQLDTLKSGIQVERTSITTVYTSLINQKQAIEDAKNSYVTNQIAYNNAVANLENLKRQKVADIAAYEALVDQAQASYDDANNPPREVDLASYRAALWEAQASLSQALANRDKARITAPIDGVVGKVDTKVGEYVGTSDEVVKLISPHFQVKVDIPETDIIKIAVNDETDITLDSYGDDVVFKGKVTEIEKGETIIQDVVYYTVTITINGDEEHEILNGMTANVIFFTADKEDVLYIPQRAVKSRNGAKFVRVLKGDIVEDVMITTGLRGDAGLIEIAKGLKEGDDVILRILEE